MAEFCLECFNKLNDTDLDEWDVVLDDDLCEGCGEWKKCVVTLRGSGHAQLFDFFGRSRLHRHKRRRED